MKKNENPTSKGRWKLLLILLVCAAPMIFSYLAYYVIKPGGRTNYGVILDPRDYPVPALNARLLSTHSTDKTTGLDAYKGKWLMLSIDGGDCHPACRKKLYDIRQLRLAQGKEMERIERVWLISDEQPVDTDLIRQHDGMQMLRVNAEIVKRWLPTEADTQISDHIYMVDPLGNLMMRFPKDADPNKMKKDIAKLLKASSIG
ncbi:SCO family protein [Undibacterium sp. SXout7W]|uniref:SCO family protein n=1 Tax=Undibacterium sp. SXout7W TaxID=3413049 RepID=UPI003BEFF9EE